MRFDYTALEAWGLATSRNALRLMQMIPEVSRSSPGV